MLFKIKINVMEDFPKNEKKTTQHSLLTMHEENIVMLLQKILHSIGHWDSECPLKF